MRWIVFQRGAVRVIEVQRDVIPVSGVGVHLGIARLGMDKVGHLVQVLVAISYAVPYINYIVLVDHFQSRQYWQRAVVYLKGWVYPQPE